jgi:hypothetical protein
MFVVGVSFHSGLSPEVRAIGKRVDLNTKEGGRSTKKWVTEKREKIGNL